MACNTKFILYNDYKGVNCVLCMGGVMGAREITSGMTMTFEKLQMVSGGPGPRQRASSRWQSSPVGVGSERPWEWHLETL